MGSASKGRREFRAIDKSRDASLIDLHTAYWNGKFESGTRSCIQCVPNGLEEPCEAPREFVSRWTGWGSPWIPLEVRKARPGKRQWRAMARISELDFKDLAEHWHRTFGRFTIPQRDLEEWLEERRTTTGKNDALQRKIEAVLREAALIAQQLPKMSNLEIAHRLVDENRAEGYSFDSVKKILYGNFPAQHGRRILGLRDWMHQQR